MPNPTLIEVKRWVQTQVGNKRLKHIQGVCQTVRNLQKETGYLFTSLNWHLGCTIVPKSCRKKL